METSPVGLWTLRPSPKKDTYLFGQARWTATLESGGMLHGSSLAACLRTLVRGPGLGFFLPY